jgi:hypothetical protein
MFAHNERKTISYRIFAVHVYNTVTLFARTTLEARLAGPVSASGLLPTNAKVLAY